MAKSFVPRNLSSMDRTRVQPKTELTEHEIRSSDGRRLCAKFHHLMDTGQACPVLSSPPDLAWGRGRRLCAKIATCHNDWRFWEDLYNNFPRLDGRGQGCPSQGSPGHHVLSASQARKSATHMHRIIRTTDISVSPALLQGCPGQKSRTSVSTLHKALPKCSPNTNADTRHGWTQ